MNESPLAHPQEIIDGEHLRLLAICYYVLGGITIAFSCFGLLYVFMGLFLALFPDAFHGPNGQPAPPPQFMGYLVSFVGGMIVLVGWTIGGLTIYAGRCIHHRAKRAVALVVAALNCINCMFMPFGPILGIASFLVLTRKSVVKLFDS